jgi:hypothetical protein
MQSTKFCTAWVQTAILQFCNLSRLDRYVNMTISYKIKLSKQDIIFIELDYSGLLGKEYASLYVYVRMGYSIWCYPNDPIVGL